MNSAVRIIACTVTDLAAAVDYTNGESIVVRWRDKPQAPQWRCAQCGRQRTPSCQHAQAVCLALSAHGALTNERTAS